MNETTFKLIISTHFQEDSSEEESSDESDGDDDPELMAERGTYKKPGGKDKYGKATKGRRGK